MSAKPQESFWSSWRERLTALRNVPPVLKIVWRSGPGVVTYGLVARVFASLLPVALIWITKLIIDIISISLSTHRAGSTPPVVAGGGEFGLAVLTASWPAPSTISDSLLAEKYTRHVSIEVMKHAVGTGSHRLRRSGFLRSSRARSRPGHGSPGHDSIDWPPGCSKSSLPSSMSIAVVVLFSPWLMLMLVAGVIPAFLGESHFAFLGYAKNFRQTPNPPPTRLSARARRQQRGRKRTQTLRPAQLPYRKIHPPLRPDLHRETLAWPAAV